MIIMTEHGSARVLSEVEISAFEIRLGFSLPTDYRHFLLAQNGGMPRHSHFLYTPRSGTPEWAAVSDFYSLAPEPSPLWTDIELRTPLWDERPAGAISIAYCQGGSEILLFLAGPRKGQVWFKDYGSCSGYDNPEEELYFLAPTFDAFTSQLKPCPFE